MLYAEVLIRLKNDFNDLEVTKAIEKIKENVDVLSEYLPSSKLDNQSLKAQKIALIKAMIAPERENRPSITEARLWNLLIIYSVSSNIESLGEFLKELFKNGNWQIIEHYKNVKTVLYRKQYCLNM